uniref:G_PROTEIN_RECEP_F1_2 domain-containing protein n=1 Tax=Steinernema glaseri TaxID=37863 RepID=A0A1I8AW61_9BILA
MESPRNDSSGALELVPPAMIWATAIMSIFGACGNALIVVATLTSKHLQTRCNIFIFILAMTDCIICVYLTQLRIYMFAKYYFVPNNVCFFSSVHGIFALNFQAAMGLVLGLDRLGAVSFPFRYKSLDSRQYITAMLAPAFIYSVVFTAIGASAVDTSPVPFCLPPTAYNGRSRMIWIGANLVIVVLVIFVYGVAQFKVYRMKKSAIVTSIVGKESVNVHRMQRLLTSLTIIVLIYSATWAVTVFTLVLCQVFAAQKALYHLIEQQLGWLVIINASSAFPVYMWRAAEYRRAVLRLLPFSRFYVEPVPQPVTVRPKEAFDAGPVWNTRSSSRRARRSTLGSCADARVPT